MSLKELKKGDRVVFHNILYSSVNHMTYGAEYTLAETPQQEVWEHSNGMPFYPELKLTIMNDAGELIRLKASRFTTPETYAQWKEEQGLS